MTRPQLDSEVDLRQRLTKYGQRGMRWARIALTAPQITAHALPGFDARTKRTDTRYRWFVERCGSQCWELDALNPVALRAEVEGQLRRLIVWEAWECCRVTEAAECESLSTILSTWTSAISGQGRK